jgi:hypothetical protein
MSSLRRINSSRANAARSRGPITPEGKERSSANALRHGLLANCVVLKNESSQCFDDLVTQHIQRFAPADGVEFAMIEEMVAANWRMRRAWAIENRLMEKAIRNQPPGDEVARIAAAFSQLAASPELNLLHRYEARLHRIYQRALNNLLMLGEPELPKEPSPISEHPVAQIPGGDVREVDIPTTRIETAPLDAPIATEGGGGRRAQPRAPDLSGPAQTGGACGVGTRPPGPRSRELPAAASEDAAGPSRRSADAGDASCKESPPDAPYKFELQPQPFETEWLTTS